MSPTPDKSAALPSFPIVDSSGKELPSFDAVPVIRDGECPLFLESVSAGFPLPVDGSMERGLDLHSLCVKHPSSTFFVRAGGDSMIGAGIFEGDILVVDRSLTATEGDVIIAALYGELTVKRLSLSPSPRLLPENDNYSPIEILDDADWEIFGVVTTVIHSLKGKLA